MIRLVFVIVAAFSAFTKAIPLESIGTTESALEVLKNIGKCSSDGGVTGIVNCAAAKALKSVENADRQPIIELLPGITLISDNPPEKLRRGKQLQNEELPQEPEKRSSKLLDLILEATTRFFSSRTLKIKFPESTPQSLARALEEGRGKMKKMMGPLMLGLGAKMITVVPLMLGGLALLAAKALLVGKLAFVISVLLFVQYFFSGRPIVPITPYYGGGYSGYGSGYGYGSYGTNNLGGWGTSQLPYGPYARSINVGPEETKTAQELAYSSNQ